MIQLEYIKNYKEKSSITKSSESTKNSSVCDIEKTYVISISKRSNLPCIDCNHRLETYDKKINGGKIYGKFLLF
jgi:hypothetical protein